LFSALGDGALGLALGHGLKELVLRLAVQVAM
jgi:hypothetical protein